MNPNEREFSDQRGDRDVRSIGPFDHFDVTVNGFTVPGISAQYRSDGSVELTLDRRFAIDLPADLAGMVIEFVANAIAVALGWSCHPHQGWTPDNDVPGLRLQPWHQLHGVTMDDES